MLMIDELVKDLKEKGMKVGVGNNEITDIPVNRETGNVKKRGRKKKEK